MVCLKVAFHLQQQIDILDDFMTALKDFGYLNNAKAMRMINYQTEELMWKKKKKSK